MVFKLNKTIKKFLFFSIILVSSNKIFVYIYITWKKKLPLKLIIFFHWCYIRYNKKNCDKMSLNERIEELKQKLALLG